MCIMEVRAGQRSSTIAQACAHNIQTVLDDAEMFCTLLTSRGEHERVKAVRRSMENLKRAHADTLELFGEFAGEEEALYGRHHDHDDGTHERLTPEEIDALDAAVNPNNPGYVPPHRRADVGSISHTGDDERPDHEHLSDIEAHDASLARPYETR